MSESRSDGGQSGGCLRANLAEVLHLAQKRGGVPPSSFRFLYIVTAAAAVAALLEFPLALPAVLAQEATPGVLPPADPRTDGVAPGMGDGPLVAAMVVLAIGLVAVLMTLLYVRLVARR